jgi:hypothetical protein
VPFQVESIDEADVEFLALPPGAREVFIAAFRELALSASPVTSGVGWCSEELRRNQRVAPEGLFSLHVQELWRGVYYRRRQRLVFIAFGFRLPDFYTKLIRLRQSLETDSRPSQEGRSR